MPSDRPKPLGLLSLEAEIARRDNARKAVHDACHELRVACHRVRVARQQAGLPPEVAA